MHFKPKRELVRLSLIDKDCYKTLSGQPLGRPWPGPTVLLRNSIDAVGKVTLQESNTVPGQVEDTHSQANAVQSRCFFNWGGQRVR